MLSKYFYYGVLVVVFWLLFAILLRVRSKISLTRRVLSSINYFKMLEFRLIVFIKSLSVYVLVERITLVYNKAYIIFERVLK